MDGDKVQGTSPGLKFVLRDSQQALAASTCTLLHQSVFIRKLPALLFEEDQFRRPELGCVNIRHP